MNYFRSIGASLLVVHSLTGVSTGQVRGQLNNAQNAQILEDRNSRQRLKDIQKNLPKVEATAGNKLKEAIINYNAPNKDLEAIKFKLKAINFTPKSQLISELRLKQLTSKYLQKSISFNDIQRLRVDIINEYQKLGYTLSTVNIPAQKLIDNKLKMELIESKVKRIGYSGNKYLPDNYFDAYVGKYREKYFNLRDLEHDLMRFNETSKADMVAKSKASDVHGYSDLVFDVYEPKRWNINTTSDNYGTERTGEWRINSSVAVYDIFSGLDDNLVLGTTQSEGSNSWYGVYDRPLNTIGTRGSLSITTGRTNVSAGPDDTLDIDGSAESLTLKIEHLLYFSKNTSLYGNIGYRYSNSDSFFTGNFIDDTRINAAFIGLSGDSRDDHGSWYGEMKLNFGSAERFDDPAQNYTTFRLSAQRTQNLGDHWTANFRFSGQVGDDTRLPSAESHFVGGQSTVRGFEEGAALGAHGLNVNLELATMPFRQLKLAENNTLNNIKFTLFTDHGTVFTDKGGDIGDDSDSFTSYGAALLYQPMPGLVLSLTYANPFDIDPDLYIERNWVGSIGYSLTF